MTTPVDILKAGLAEIHESEDFSDCKVICGPHRFNVHKNVLCAQSDFFKAALKRENFKEGESGVIELKASQNDSSDADAAGGDDPEIVKLMMRYFYYLDYSPKDPKTEKVFLIEHAKVFAAAVKYGINGLRVLAAEKFKEAVKTHWSHVDFTRTVFIVYNSTPVGATELCELVADTIHENFHGLKDNAGVEALMRSDPGLSFELLKRSRKHDDPKEITCRAGHKTSIRSRIICNRCRTGFDYRHSCFNHNSSVTCHGCERTSAFKAGYFLG